MNRGHWGLVLCCIAVGAIEASCFLSGHSEYRRRPSFGNQFDLSIWTPFELVSEAPWMVLSYAFLIFSDVFYLLGCVVKKFGFFGPFIDVLIVVGIVTNGSIISDAISQFSQPFISRASTAINDNISYLNAYYPISKAKPARGGPSILEDAKYYYPDPGQTKPDPAPGEQPYERGPDDGEHK